jgi:hypothetical protein
MGMSKEDFYRYTGPDVWECVMDYCRRVVAPPKPVASIRDRPVVMWLTFDELYDLPMVKEFLSPAKVLEEMRAASAKNRQISP